jgi:flagellar motility protein MotE (MotC chaperone)
LLQHFQFHEWIDTRKLPWREKIIDATGSKSDYFRQMDEFREARANKCHEIDIHVCIEEMCTHMREIELKKEEEELKQREEALKQWEEELRIREEQLEKHKKKCVTAFHCTL